MAEDVEKLPSFLLKQLYGQVLIATTETASLSTQSAALSTAAIISEGPLPKHTLGENQKKILILVNDAAAATLPETDLAFLMNILHACKLSIRDVLILNIHDLPDKNYSGLLQTYTPAVCLLFGLNPADLSLPLHFPNYQIQGFNHVRFLSAPNLSDLQRQDAEKRKLWAGLKQLFLS